jgi:hypothetical protein
MRITQSTLPLLALALLAGCAATPDEPTTVAQAGAQDDVVCFFEAPTGTNRKIRRCMSKEEYNKSMDTAQRTAGEIRIPPPPPR